MQSESVVLIIFVCQFLVLRSSDGARQLSDIPRLLIISLDGEKNDFDYYVENNLCFIKDFVINI